MLCLHTCKLSIVMLQVSSRSRRRVKVGFSSVMSHVAHENCFIAVSSVVVLYDHGEYYTSSYLDIVPDGVHSHHARSRGKHLFRSRRINSLPDQLDGLHLGKRLSLICMWALADDFSVVEPPLPFWKHQLYTGMSIRRVFVLFEENCHASDPLHC